jgi:cytoskeletal protein CcmA (bactofilin family)
MTPQWLKRIGWYLFSALLVLGCTSGDREHEQMMTVQQALTPAQTVKFAFSLPSSGSFETVVAGATETLKIDDRARVQFVGGQPAPVSNSGSVGQGTTVLGSDARSGTIESQRAVSILDRARVEGNVTSASSITRGNSTVVTGTVTPNAALSFDRYSWNVTFPAASTSVTVPVNGTGTLNPGSYENVTVFSGGHLRLQAGTYYLNSIQLESLSWLDLNTTAGPIFIYVRNSVIWRGTTTFVGSNDRLFVGYAGTNAIAIEGLFQGTLVAPFAWVRMATGGAVHAGAVYGKLVEIDPDVRLSHRLFSGWDTITFDVEPRFECVEHRPHGSHVAHFGYRNPNTKSVTVPVGADNRFTPGVQDRKQPTTFAPGKHGFAFAVTWLNFLPTWTLNGNSVAPNLAKVCPATVNVDKVLADTTVVASNATANFGTATTLEVAPGKQTLVEFDRSAIRSVVGQRLVKSAHLELTLEAGATNSGVEALAMRRRWSETGATWNCANDQDASASGESCKALDKWKMGRRDFTWDNPWERITRAGGEASPGSTTGGLVSFDVTDDLQEFLGPERANGGISWVLLPTGSGSTRLLAKESGVRARLVLELVAFTDFDAANADDSSAPLSFEVASIAHPFSSLPGIGGGTSRPVAATQSPEGRVAQFVANEIVIGTDDATLLSTVKARWNAIELGASPLQLPGFPTMHLLRVDPSLGDAATLVPNLLSRSSALRGKNKVSSLNALKVLAIAADETVRGTPVMINWVTTSDALSVTALNSETLIDGTPVGPDGSPGGSTISSSPNVYDWPHFGPGMHDITQAWEKIFFSKDDTWTIDVVIADRGYSHLADLDFNGGCFQDCSNDLESGKEWHGTHVANAGFGEPGNSYGAAGPGWPVSDVYLNWSHADWWTMTGDIAEFVIRGMDIVNYSQGIPVPYWANLLGGQVTLDIAEATTTGAARALGTLIFASAGNDGVNVDEDWCYEVKEPISEIIGGLFGSDGWTIVTVCPWEKEWWWPCENDGVNCVAATKNSSRTLTNYSNYGKSIAYWGVGDILSAADPSNMADVGNNCTDMSGTSFASPVISGIASLVWAANYGSMDAGDVEDCMSASTGTYFVNASNAVSCAKTPSGGYDPYIEIVSPADGSSYGSAGIGVNLRAVAGDYEDGAATYDIAWSSDVEGPLGITGSGGDLFYSTASPGLRVITASTVDSDGNTRSDKITLSFMPAPPLVQIVLPEKNGDRVIQGLPVDMFAKVTNRFATLCGPFKWDAWHENNDYFFNHPECRRQDVFSLAGGYKLTAAYTDAQGSGAAFRTIEAYNDGKPHVKITSPLGFPDEASTHLLAVVSSGSTVALDAAAVPFGGQFDYTWIFTPVGGESSVIGEMKTFDWPTSGLQNCDYIRGTLTVSIADSMGNLASDTIDVKITAPCPPK